MTSRPTVIALATLNQYNAIPFLNVVVAVSPQSKSECVESMLKTGEQNYLLQTNLEFLFFKTLTGQ